MSAALYPSAKEAFLSGSINMSSDTIKAVIVSTSASYNSAHDNYDDVSANAICTPVTLASKTVTNGAFDAADIAPSDVNGNIGAIIIYKETGSASTSTLIAWIDNMPELPASISPGTVNVTWDTYIFTL